MMNPRFNPACLWAALLLLSLGIREGHADEKTHKYAVGEKVRLWVNKVGPYNNPQETYNYYYLPFCAPPSEQKPMHKWGGLGEVLGGNQLIDSQLDIKYRVDVPKTAICSTQLDGKSMQAFQNAIKKYYWYELL